MVTDTQSRKLPHRLGRDEGVSLKELGAGRIEAEARSIWPARTPPCSNSLIHFLRALSQNQTGKFVVAPAQQALIRNLGIQALACQVVPPSLYDAGEELKEQRRLTIES